jgi:hypothetical protein
MRRLLIAVLFSTSLAYGDELSTFSLNGYADANMTVKKNSSSFSIGEFAPLFQFQYNRRVLFRSNLFFKLANDTTTRTELNCFILDYFLNDNLILELGKFPSPYGQFRQYLRPSWINVLPSQPVGFSDELSVAPLHNVGIKLKGAYYLGPTKVHFDLTVSNGPELINKLGQVDVNSEESNTDSNMAKLIGLRLGMSPTQNMEVNVSGAAGKIGLGSSQDRTYKIIGTDFVCKNLNNHLNGFRLRAEYLKLFAELTDDSKKTESAWYIEPSYNIPETQFQLALRYGEFKTDLKNSFSSGSGSEIMNVNRVHTKRAAYGVNYILYPSVIIKGSYSVDHVEGSSQKTSVITQIVAGF